jgi:ABC-type dipeptide/oligopeptide/nickel transport system permease subunit
MDIELLYSKKNRLLVIGTILVTILLFVTLTSSFFEPNDPAKITLSDKNQSPNAKYPLGTDSMGRCILSRILDGAKSSLGIAFAAVSLSIILGSVIGVASGYAGGVIDGIVMRITDMFLSFPSIILALTILAIAGPGFFNVVFSLSAVGWTHVARLTRGVTMTAKNSETIQAAKAIGNNARQIMVNYMLPQIAPKVIILIPLDIGKTIMASAALSFLGLGIQPPAAEWGSMLNEARQFIRSAPYEILFPALALFLSSLSFNILGEGIRAKLDPYIAQ